MSPNSTAGSGELVKGGRAWGTVHACPHCGGSGEIIEFTTPEKEEWRRKEIEKMAAEIRERMEEGARSAMILPPPREPNGRTSDERDARED